MNINISFIKLISKLLILMILFVIVYMISALLYSARYWPDIYNYINSNITIKRIPTISELNYTIIEIDYTTESTTFDYDLSTTDASTDTIDIIDKRDLHIENNDYLELPTRGVLIDYMFDETDVDSKIIKDVIDDSKLAKNKLEDVELFYGSHKIIPEFEETVRANDEEMKDIEVIFPGIVTIFIKNDSANDQFAYFCDGALLTDTKILTAARCVNYSNVILKPEDLLVVLGKSSLHQMASREKVSRISQIIVHDDFSNGDDGVKNDLAVLVLDEPVKFTKYIKPANISKEEDFQGIKQSATTAWAITGKLEPVFFEKIEYLSCPNNADVEDALCATYGYDVTLCPSYGGLFAVKRESQWRLEGIMSGDPSKRGICFNKSVTYTYLENYLDWIRDIVYNK